MFQVLERDNILENSIFSYSTQQILHKTKISVGVFIDNNFEIANKIVLLIYHVNDLKLIKYAQKFIHNIQSQVIIIDNRNIIQHDTTALELIRSIEHFAPNHITRYTDFEINKEFIHEQDLIILSTESWKELFNDQNQWVSDIPSTLLIKDRD